MNERIEELTEKCVRNAGAGERAIEDLESALGIRLPNEYLQFMKESNGTEGFVGEDAYLMLWPIEELLELNRGYAADEFAPGLVLFGSNGGDTAYAFDTRSEMLSIVELPLVGMALDQVAVLGITFQEFLEQLNQR